MEERDPNNRANFLPEIECDSAKPSVRSRKDIYPTGLKNCLPVVKCIEIRPPVYLVKDDHVKFWRRVQYLVKWIGYQESFNSWIFKQDLQKRGVAVWSVSLVNGTAWHVERRLHVRRSYFCVRYSSCTRLS